MINITLVLILFALSVFIFSLFKYTYEYAREEIRQYRLSPSKNIYRILKALRIPLVVLLVPFLGFLIISAQPDYDLSDPKEKVRYGEQYENKIMLLEGYQELLYNEPQNPEWHYRLFREIDKGLPLKLKYQNPAVTMKGYYDSLVYVEGYHDIGVLGQGLIAFVYDRDYENAMAILNTAQDTTLPFLNYTKANIAFKDQKIAEAIHYHLNEINVKGYKHGSIYSLAEFYLNHHMLNEAHALVKLDPFLEYLPLNRMRDRVFIPRYDVKNYILSYVMRHVRYFTLWGFIGSLVVLAAWIFYLQKLDVFSSIPLGNQLITVFLGMLFIFLVYPFSDVLDYYFLDYFIRGKFEVFVMCVVRIGMVEEFVKLAPLLLIMRFTKWFKDPYDYVFYACSSALGFAFLENVVYSSSIGTFVIASRGMIAVVMHMICSSIIAYAIILAKYKQIGNMPLNILIGFIVASFVHGFYDFWFITGMFTLLSYLIFFLTVINWRRIINNAINNSKYFDVRKLVHFNDVEFYLITILVSILTFEYVLNGLEQDAKEANKILSKSFIRNGYMAIYLVLSIGKIDIFPGYWQKLGFPRSIPEFFIPKGINPMNFLGYKVKLKLGKENINLSYVKVVTGKVTRRLILSGELNWFMIYLDKPIVYNGNFYYRLMINFKTPEVRLKENFGVRATLRLPLEELNPEQIEFSKKSTLWVGYCLVQKMP